MTEKPKIGSRTCLDAPVVLTKIGSPGQTCRYHLFRALSIFGDLPNLKLLVCVDLCLAPQGESSTSVPVGQFIIHFRGSSLCCTASGRRGVFIVLNIILPFHNVHTVLYCMYVHLADSQPAGTNSCMSSSYSIKAVHRGDSSIRLDVVVNAYSTPQLIRAMIMPVIRPSRPSHPSAWTAGDSALQKAFRYVYKVSSVVPSRADSWTTRVE